MISYNEQDIIQTYEFLNHNAQTEIRLIDPHGKKPVKTLFINNKEQFINTCIQYSGDYHLCVGINERKENGSKKEDIKTIQTIVLDIDPNREKNTASTKQELESALKVANEIQTYLKNENIESYKALSGNGIHLWIPTPLFFIKNKEDSEMQEKIIKQFHQHIKKKFETDDITIDNIGDLPRLIKVTGTLSIKGENTEERPRRLSKWIDKPTRKENKGIIKLLKQINDKIKEETKEIPVNKNINQKLRLLISYDKELNKLFNNKTKQAKYNSRSELEAAIVTKLCVYHLPFSEIDEIMKFYQMKKWSEGVKYQQHTYKKCKDFSEKLPQNQLSEYLEIVIKKIKIYSNKEESITKIITNFGEIELNTTTLINCNVFKSIYYVQSYGTMLPPISSEIWAKILTYWTSEHGERIHVHKLTEEEELREKVLEEIRNFNIVEEIEETLFYGRLFVDKETQECLIPGSSILTILKKNKSKVKPSKLAFLLQDYLKQTSKPKKVKGQSKRFWFFDYNMLYNNLEEVKQ